MSIRISFCHVALDGIHSYFPLLPILCFFCPQQVPQKVLSLGSFLGGVTHTFIPKVWTLCHPAWMSCYSFPLTS